MVFYTFLLKFYRLAGGDEGMRMLHPYLLGSEWSGFSKTAYLIGPYYYFSLAVLVPPEESGIFPDLTVVTRRPSEEP